jgi:AraC-like DNA-binding protein
MDLLQTSLYTTYAVAIALCAFSTAMLVGLKGAGGARFSFFAVYLALESLCFLFELLVAHPSTPLKALWLSMLMCTSLLIAPALWLAIRENVEGERVALSSLDWRHWGIIVAGVLFTLPLLETAHLGQAFVNPLRTEPTLFAKAIHPTMLLCIGLFAIQAPVYLLKSRHLLQQTAEANRWLSVSLLIVGTTWMAGVLRTVVEAFSDRGQRFFALLAFLDVLVTIGCVYYIMRRLTHLHVLASVPSGAPMANAQAQYQVVKYAKSQLDAPVRARIVQKVDKALRDEQLYRNSALNLRTLSSHLKENEHYVSQVLNQELGTTFYELVNSLRIEHAKRLLMSDAERNVLDVALEVGFNAKSTFNTAFKRHAGMTPSEFRASGATGSAHEVQSGRPELR